MTARPVPAPVPTVLAPTDATLARALGGLSNPARLTILRQLRTPRTLREIEVQVPDEDRGAGEARLISRQAVREHLDRLLEIGVVLGREATRAQGPTTEYLLNHQMLFAFSEEFRGFARLRPEEPPPGATLADPAQRLAPVARGPRLVVVKGLDEGRAFPLDETAAGARAGWVIGRRSDSAVPLDFDPFVSGDNTAVLREGGRFLVADLPESRNGTTLNFERLGKGERRPLEHGDVVGVGRCLLLFRDR